MFHCRWAWVQEIFNPLELVAVIEWIKGERDRQTETENNESKHFQHDWAIDSETKAWLTPKSVIAEKQKKKKGNL